jgi:hypothetical protein
MNIIAKLRFIAQMPRWNEYEIILQNALDNGYIVTSLIDWYEHYMDDPGSKVLIMRHDVDFSKKGAERMLEIERKLGVYSTFYFRWSTANKELIDMITEYGSEVGLHYETLASYAIEHNIYTKDELGAADYINCQKELINEIKRFNELYGTIKTAASHGDARNRMLGVSNNTLIENGDLQDFGLVTEAYNKEIHKRFDIYISDTSVDMNYWRYGTSPQEAISQGLQTILLLTHPIHWNRNPVQSVFSAVKVRIKQKINC